MVVVALLIECASVVAAAQPPATPAMVDTATVKVLTGLTVQEFEAEMQLMTQALGLSCGSCHARGNFASAQSAQRSISLRCFQRYKQPAGGLGVE